LPKKTEGNAPKQSKNIYKPKNGKKYRKIEEKTEAQRLLLLLLLYFNWDLPI